MTQIGWSMLVVGVVLLAFPFVVVAGISRFVSPELRLIESKSLRNDVGGQAWRVLRKRLWYWVLCAAFMTFVVVVSHVSTEWPSIILQYIAFFGFLALTRRYMRIGIRKEMIARMICVGCGYDLTGNVSGVCPECGTKIEKP